MQVTNINGNAGVAVWDKSGTLVMAPKHLNTLWTGYVGTHAGNGCATHDDGDPVVVYDQLADRWFLTQFSLPHINSSDTGPGFQCVAVSKTADPTGPYWLYDFTYPHALNDYGKFGLWPDAYYATFNEFGTTAYHGADFCAYDRASMLAGAAASQQCFFQAAPPAGPACPATQPFVAGNVLPISMDGKIAPPAGAPGYSLQFDYSQCGPTYDQLDLWSLHVDWTTPANSKLTGPTVVAQGLRPGAAPDRRPGAAPGLRRVGTTRATTRA